MEIVIDPREAPARIALAEPDSFTRFSVVVLGDGDPTGAISRIGAAAGDDHVHVDPDALKGLAGPLAAQPDWLAQLAGMTDDATTKGWTDDRGWIRAHVERRAA